MYITLYSSSIIFSLQMYLIASNNNCSSFVNGRAFTCWGDDWPDGTADFASCAEAAAEAVGLFKGIECW